MRNIIIGSFTGFVLAAAFFAACGGGGVAPQANLSELADQVSQLEARLSLLANEQARTEDELETAKTAIAELEDLTQYLSLSDRDLILTGANLHVRSGSGSTGGAVNGLGNIIIGYNELRTATGAVNDRSGSHMFVVGQRQNYSSYGGIVAGDANTVSGTFACVLAGFDSEASGHCSSVCGGGSHLASGYYATVSGGAGCEATHSASTCSGGQGWKSRANHDHIP